MTDEPRFLYSEIVPRQATGPDLRVVGERLVRASERYNELAAHVHQMKTSIKRAPNVTARAADLSRPNPPLTLDWNDALPQGDTRAVRMLLSETLHHLRCAGDYLIYNASWLDSGIENPDTQFPIFGNRKGFQGRGRTMVKGLNSAHVAWLEAVQPFNGVSWTGALRRLSNADKHRYLLEVTPTLRYRIALHAAVPIPGDQTVRLPTDQLELKLRLIPREGGPYLEVGEMLPEIFTGLADLTNKFFAEVNIAPMSLTPLPG